MELFELNEEELKKNALPGVIDEKGNLKAGYLYNIQMKLFDEKRSKELKVFRQMVKLKYLLKK